MNNEFNEYPDEVYCPLTDTAIQSYECVETSDIAAGMFKERCLADKYKQKENWKEICKNCKYHNY